MKLKNIEDHKFKNDVPNSAYIFKSKITKILNSEENQFGKSIITWQNQKTKRIKNEWTRTVIFLTWYRHFQM